VRVDLARLYHSLVFTGPNPHESTATPATSALPHRAPPSYRPRQAEGDKKVPLEVNPDVKHTEGVLSMGRFDDPNSGTSSFSILLGAAPHLDNQVGRDLSCVVWDEVQTVPLCCLLKPATETAIFAHAPILYPPAVHHLWKG
jgi:cyclophilin family peptidyl-prolyl cis-trans isomerase